MTPNLKLKKRPTRRHEDSKEGKKKFTWNLSVFVLAVGLFSATGFSFAGEDKLLFLPKEPAFEKLIIDPREPHDAVLIQSGINSYEGAVGSFIELLQWRPADGSRWGWGILGAAYIGLATVDAAAYPKRISRDNGLLTYNLFPERVSDWQLGTYFSQSSGDFSNRLEYVHFSSHLGDELFDYVPRFIYTRESFRFTSSFQPSENFRIYAGAGYWGHIDPLENPFFIHTGAELYTNLFEFLFKTNARGYCGFDLKIKDEAGGVVNQAFQWGLQWKWKKESRQSVRLAVLYYNGNSEFGQFYREKDEHWGFGIYFDP